VQRAARFAQLGGRGIAKLSNSLSPAIVQNGLLGEVSRSEMSLTAGVSGQHVRLK
jgi:hypothetical protein